MAGGSRNCVKMGRWSSKSVSVCRAKWKESIVRRETGADPLFDLVGERRDKSVNR
jgi:hypothetical protein